MWLRSSRQVPSASASLLLSSSSARSRSPDAYCMSEVTILHGITRTLTLQQVVYSLHTDVFMPFLRLS